MSRRDRTTGLPRRQERAAASEQSTFLGLRWSEWHTRWSILGGAVVLLLIVIGMYAWGWYDENVRMPRTVVVRVDAQEYTLGYYTERLSAFAQQNPSLSEGFREPALLTQLEDEALAIIAAEARGIDLSDEALTAWIAEDLGVPVGGSGSSFDTLYRQALRTQGLSDADYRRLATAQLANERLLEQLTEERGEVGEMYTLRIISVSDEEAAEAVIERIEGGEDMGTIAQTESLDLESRQEDGLTQPTPTELFHEDVQAVVAGQEEDTLLEPITVGDLWWVVRIERFQEDGTYTETHRTQLAQLDLQALLDETRSGAGIEQNLGTDEINWAYDHVDAVSAAQ